MKQKIYIGLVCALIGGAVPAVAQETFWGFDDDNNEIYIPVQCDGRFNEELGGVFIPTPAELYEQGEIFLAGDKKQQAQAGYCFMSAALQGNVDAQYRLAQLYQKGVAVPQNDMMAYKWAYTAALSGHAEAQRLSLTLEQFLTAEDIEAATKEVPTVLPVIQGQLDSELSAQDRVLTEKRNQLEAINQEIDKALGVTLPQTANKPAQPGKTAQVKGTPSKAAPVKTPAQNDAPKTARTPRGR